jgi:hypothetical protein
MDARELRPHPSLESYAQEATDLVEKHKAGNADALRRVQKARRGKSEQTTTRETLALADAQFVVAHEYGFENWPTFTTHIEALNQAGSPIVAFETATDALISGDLLTLEALLHQDPHLIRARSTRMHHATLLHYVAANGVEDYRQKSPFNAVLVAQSLLEAGAEADALADTYAGGATETTLNLLVSSIHPARAGVQVALVHTLLNFGAAINGVADDESPLITALAFGYRKAAEALAERGARIDTVATAAGLGRADLVTSFLALNSEVHLVRVPWLRVANDRSANLELALAWANVHGRTDIVELLTQTGVNPHARDQWGRPLT